MALRFLGGSAQTRYAAGTREILECFPGRARLRGALAARLDRRRGV